MELVVTTDLHEEVKFEAAQTSFHSNEEEELFIECRDADNKVTREVIFARGKWVRADCARR